MNTIKTSELTGNALNFAVAICEGWEYSTAQDDHSKYPWFVKGDKDMNPKNYRPSANWMQGGPIIKRYISRLEYLSDVGWEACGFGFTAHGPTPLIAAMRCFVASKLGDEVDVPEELVCN